MAQRYYWLKMKKDFAKDKRIKKLKRIPGGLNFAFIYLEMILNAVDTEGILIYEGVEDTPAKEFALELDEDPDSVQITMSYLLSVGLMTDLGDGRFLLPYVTENLGSEGASAKRVRDFRERKKALQCNTNVTEEKREALQCNTDVTDVKQNSNVETETDKETDKETDIETDRLRIQGCLSENKNIPSLEDITQYAVENHMRLDPVKFYKKNQERGWITKKGEPVKNWKRLMWFWNDKEDIKQAAKQDEFMQNTYDFDQLEKDFVRN